LFREDVKEAVCAAVAVTRESEAHKHNMDRCRFALRYLRDALFDDSNNEFAVICLHTGPVP